MIVVADPRYRALCQRVNGGGVRRCGCWGLGGVWGAGGGVVAGGGQDGGDGVGGAGGDGGEEADLVHVVFVEGLDVECLVERGLQVDGVSEQGQVIEKGGVVVAGGCLVEGL